MPKDDDNTQRILNSLTGLQSIGGLRDTEGAYGGPKEVLNRIFEKTVELKARLMTTAAEIDSNPAWTGVGKKEAKVEAKPALFTELNALRSEADKLNFDYRAKAQAARSKAGKPDPTAQAILDVEMRSIIAQRVPADDNLGMMEFVNEAVATSDTHALDAILRAPNAWPYLDLIDDFDALGEARLEMLDGEHGTEAAAIGKVVKELHEKFNIVENDILELADDAPDELKEIAHGDLNPE